MSRPSFQFFYGDWCKDTRMLTLETRGAWFEIIGLMWERKQHTFNWNLEDYRSYLGCQSTDTVLTALRQLGMHEVADLSWTIVLEGNQIVNNLSTEEFERLYVEESGNPRKPSAKLIKAKICCRKIRKELEKHQRKAEVARENGKKGGRKKNPGNQPSSSSSSSSSLIVDTTKLKDSTSLVLVETSTAAKKKGRSCPGFSEFIAYFSAQYEAKHGKKYLFMGGRDGKAVKRLLSVTASLEELQDLTDRFFKSSDEFIRKSSYTIGTFESVLGKLHLNDPRLPGGANALNQWGVTHGLLTKGEKNE